MEDEELEPLYAYTREGIVFVGVGMFLGFVAIGTVIPLSEYTTIMVVFFTWITLYINW